MSSVAIDPACVQRRKAAIAAIGLLQKGAGMNKKSERSLDF
ncbi:hypothetical protein [Pseudaminobacter salicylatoxidans]|nr:hypothetical protein [Pseudaminobacter salicylatoxidans]